MGAHERQIISPTRQRNFSPPSRPQEVLALEGLPPAPLARGVPSPFPVMLWETRSGRARRAARLQNLPTAALRRTGAEKPLCLREVSDPQESHTKHINRLFQSSIVRRSIARGG